MQDAVLGHYSVRGSSLQPLLAESSNLFKAVVEDDAVFVAALGSALDGEATRLNNVLYWASSGDGGAQEGQQAPVANGKPVVTVKQRTLLSLSAFHAADSGRLEVLKLLLGVSGVDPRQRTPDGFNAFAMAQQANGDSEGDVLALLQAAVETSRPTSAAQHTVSLTNSVSSSRVDPLLFNAVLGAGTSAAEVSTFSDGTLAPSTSSDQGSTATALPISVDLQHHLSLHQQEVEVDPYNSEGLPYSTSELTQAEYSTDTFRMFAFKVVRCSKRFAHDWRACPFAHPTENARRRDPREFRYCAQACPDYKQGFCVRGDLCPYAHGVFEAWLHPSRYRTQLCKDGANCHRPICFFAHSLPELRTPTHTWTPSADDVTTTPLQHAGPVVADPVAAHMGHKGGRQGGAKPSTRHGCGPHSGAGLRGGMGVDASGMHSKGDAGIAGVAGMGGMAGMQYVDMHSSLGYGQQASSMVGADGGASAAVAASSPSSGSVAAAMFGFTAPRMSNAFARRHGLNPKDNAMLNLQKIALQAQPGSAAGEHLGRLFHTSGTSSNVPQGGVYPGDYTQQQVNGVYGGRGIGHAMMAQGGGRGKGGNGNAKHFNSGLMGQPGGNPLMLQAGYPYAATNGLMAMQAVAAAASHDPSLAALNHHLASLSLHPTAAAAAAAFASQAAVGMGFGSMYHDGVASGR